MPDRICPSCKNPIYDDEALSCHFCGGSMEHYSTGGLGMFKAMQWIAAVVIILILIFMFVIK